MGLFRKTRSDCTIETFARKNGISEDSFRNRDGRKTRKDKQIGNMREESKKRG